MDVVFLGIIIFLFLLAVFDLSVGVSNDAVNFLTSAIGSKAAGFKTVIAVAAVGILIGAAMSNGMMDVARHGIFRPENLSFYDVIAIFMAVMVTDIILLDAFNSIGMPTSTTVSLVFELLGATFVVALFKTASPDAGVGIGDLLNTEKALSVILGIFLSVAIAFVFGTVVQFITRLIFTFEYKRRMRWKAGLFGGIACTAIVYFMLLKGVKDLTIMTDDTKTWIANHTTLIMAASFVLFTVIMQLLHFMRVNVLKVVVLIGTFALAMAFAGNDLVNFIGVPVTSLSSYNDYMAAGGENLYGHTMDSLNAPADTPFYFLIGAGVIMVVSLATSKKARAVTQTSIGLSSSSQGDEMFGSSKLSQALVRGSLNVLNSINRHIPQHIKRWLGRRMDVSVSNAEEGAAFDLVRGSVNLMLAGVLIAWGTSMKLPLSTTFVTFMVAMGTSLADRAWQRESAVFRITGVISVIGGWFVTAGVAFIGAGIVVCLMHLGGVPVMIAGGIIALALLIRSNIRFRNKKKAEKTDTMFQRIIASTRDEDVWPLLLVYINEKQVEFLRFAASTYVDISEGFATDNVKLLSRTNKALSSEKDYLKSQRRKLTLCLRRVPVDTAMEKSTWFYLGINMSVSINYSLRHINDVCKEHVDNNFRQLPTMFANHFRPVRDAVAQLFVDSVTAINDGRAEDIDDVRRRCDEVKEQLSVLSREVYNHLHDGDSANMTVAYAYLNMLQESREMVSSLRRLLRAMGKLNLPVSSYRSFTLATSPGT